MEAGLPDAQQEPERNQNVAQHEQTAHFLPFSVAVC
jgi:hypothetical protein